MKKEIIVFCISILPISFVFPQTEVDTIQTEVDSVCVRNLEDIFKIYDLKRKFDIVEHIYNESRQKESILFSNYNYRHLNHLFELIRGIPYFEQPKDSISTVEYGKLIEIEYMSEEEVNKYIERLNYTPGEAYRIYYHSIRNIKLEKELYLKCIDMELAKNSDSEYTKEMLRYEVVIKAPRSPSHLPIISKFHFLKLFKEFILNDDEAVLPNYFRAMVYLDCGCKTPYFKEYSPLYKVEN